MKHVGQVVTGGLDHTIVEPSPGLPTRPTGFDLLLPVVENEYIVSFWSFV